MPPPDLTAEAIDDLKAFLYGLPFSGVLGDESVSLAALDFAVCVKIRPTDPMVSDSIAADNEVCPAIDIFLPPLPGDPPRYPGVFPSDRSPKPFDTASEPLASGGGFATKNDNKHFTFNIDFSAGSSADNRGYIEEVTAGIPVKVLGFGFDFLRITARAQLVPDYVGKPASEASGFSYEIRFLDQVIDRLQPTTFSISGTTGPADEEDEEDEEDEDGGFFKERCPPEVRFFVGPVPMFIEGCIGGNIGITYTSGYGSDTPPLFGPRAFDVISLGTSIGPFANLEAKLIGGFGTPAYGAGVEGVVTLFEEKIVYFIGTEIEVIDDGSSSGDVEFIITQLQKLSNIITGPVGKVNLFAQYSVPQLCGLIALAKGKCKLLKTIRVTKNIYTTPALFRREDILFEDPFLELDVVIPNGQPPAYFIASANFIASE